MNKTIKRALSLLLTLLIAVSTIACGEPVANGWLISGEYDRLSAETAENTDRFELAVTKMAFDMLRSTVATDGKAQLVSSLSAIYCLGMVANGATGQTLAEVENALGMELDDLNKEAYKYVTSMYSSNKCKIRLANSLWINDDDKLTVNGDFLQTNADWYGARIYKLLFDESTPDVINRWCKDNTDGMIDELVDTLPEDAMMLLLNTILFDAKWGQTYTEKQIAPGIFYNADGSNSAVHYMSSKENIYLTMAGAKGMAKPYYGDKYYFVGLLPDEGSDVNTLLAGITAQSWQTMWQNRETTTVKVKIPEFEYETNTMDIIPALESMGICSMFDVTADFDNTGEYAGVGLYVSDFFQKTSIRVNRNGTKASAATGAIQVPTSAPMPTDQKSVYLDRPFVYAIVDSNGVPLFVGVQSNMN